MHNKLLFIESNTTGTGMLALRKTAELGLEPIMFLNQPDRYPELQDLGYPVHICDTNDVDKLEESIRQRFSPYEIAGITTTSEFYLEITAVLATRFGLPGNSPEAIKKARIKSLTRETLEKVGVHQPLFETVRQVSEVRKAVDKIGLPCVLKPADDSGSNDVRLCDSLSEAEKHARKVLGQTINVRGQKTAGTVLVEQYLEAPEYSVEMFSWQGKIFCIGVTQKEVSGKKCFVESRHLFPAPLSRSQKEQMIETVRKALEAVGIRNGATHTEVKWTSKGCAVIEINARLAGGMIPELIRLTTGVDMLEQQIRCAVDGPTILTDPVVEGTAGIQFLMAEKAGTLIQTEGVDTVRELPGIREVKLTKEPGTSVQVPHNAYHRLGYVMACGTTADETSSMLQKAVAGITLKVRQEK